MDDRQRLIHETASRQLERMRAMQYAYHRKFFTLLMVSTLGMGVLLAFPTGATLVFLIFGLVTTAVTACFLLHFADFARTHARALEGRINRMLDERVLIASDLEASYFYRTDLPRPGPPGNGWPKTFFSFYTLHFCAIWAAAILFAGYRLWRGLPTETFLMIFATFVVWAGINGAFLRRWFRGDALRDMEEQLRAAHGGPPPASDAVAR